jgi:hypothetical protein
LWQQGISTVNFKDFQLWILDHFSDQFCKVFRQFMKNPAETRSKIKCYKQYYINNQIIIYNLSFLSLSINHHPDVGKNAVNLFGTIPENPNHFSEQESKKS